MSRPNIRCAIYTRKSSEEGLDQAFNSLDAQREACSAYIQSQRHEGWRETPVRYDDGGQSGGTLDRPALEHLLSDIDAGRISMIVVYKIDRLTRSLADFAKLVDRFDAANCSFVSVTQAFNTSSSMGRLTLNVLLSFAQFEREVTAERIRDKIAASKKKGLWMGGSLPLGYDRHSDPLRQELIPNPAEAKTVQALFELYDTQPCLNAVSKSASAMGLHTKRRSYSNGRASGGDPFSRGQIHYLLRNPVYRGLIRHKLNVYPGKHAAIINADLWTRVQVKLTAAARRQRGEASPGPDKEPSAGSLLIGKMRDDMNDRLTPTHTQRHGRRHHYYVSNRLISGGTDPSGWRLPARQLERSIGDLVASHIQDCAEQHSLLLSPEAGRSAAVSASACDLAERVRKSPTRTLPALVASVRLGAGAIAIELETCVLATALSVKGEHLSGDVKAINAPFRTRRRGVETKIITGALTPEPDKTLLRNLVAAHDWAAMIKRGIGVTNIAKRTGHSDAFIRTRTQLAFLSPRLQTAILNGTQPEGLTLKSILRAPVPLDWTAQHERFDLSPG